MIDWKENNLRQLTFEASPIANTPHTKLMVENDFTRKELTVQHNRPF